eukprot:124608-Chlamydomonas_euryale.AAC.1
MTLSPVPVPMPLSHADEAPAAGGAANGMLSPLLLVPNGDVDRRLGGLLRAMARDLTARALMDRRFEVRARLSGGELEIMFTSYVNNSVFLEAPSYILSEAHRGTLPPLEQVSLLAAAAAAAAAAATTTIAGVPPNAAAAAAAAAITTVAGVPPNSAAAAAAATTTTTTVAGVPPNAAAAAAAALLLLLL